MIAHKTDQTLQSLLDSILLRLAENDLSAAASRIRSAVSTAWNSSSDLTTRVQRNIPVNLNNRVSEDIRKTSVFARSNPHGFLLRD